MATEEEAAYDVIKPYCQQVNATPALQSLLYDIDLLPEQIKSMVNARRMVVVCEMMKLMTTEQVASMFESA